MRTAIALFYTLGVTAAGLLATQADEPSVSIGFAGLLLFLAAVGWLVVGIELADIYHHRHWPKRPRKPRVRRPYTDEEVYAAMKRMRFPGGVDRGV